jgi:hypothetical protein
MAVDKHITEGIPYVLSNPITSTAFISGGESYDMAISGIPFFMASSDNSPYRRQTAPYRKQQIDQTTEPGEQTLTGWWLRSQSSFHSGCGIKYYDPTSNDENGHYRFSDSRGVDVWTKGQVSLLNSSTQTHNVTNTLYSNGRTAQFTRSIKWGSTNGILMLDGYDVDKIDAAGNVTHFIDYNAGVGVFPVYAICDDGTYAYWVTNVTSGSSKLSVFKKPLTGSSASTADEVLLYQDNSTISNATIEYVKNRLVLCADNKIYELTTSPGSTTLPTPVYTHSVTTYTFSSITASGAAIYVSGYNGLQSTILKFTLTTAGAMPVLTAAVVAAELPVGEVVHRISYYLGYMMVGTSLGVRVAAVSDTDGSVTYGPLVVETTQPCYDFAARDKYVWCATSVAGEPGLIRIDLSNQISLLQFAWAYDVYYPGVTGFTTTSCAFISNTQQIAYTTANNGVDGYVYIEHATNLVSSGYITTGRIRYATLEGKVFKFLKALVNNVDGGFSVASISPLGTEYSLGVFAEDDSTPELGIIYPAGTQEYLSFKFTLLRSATNTAAGAIFSGYQVKGLPSIRRQRLIQYALKCYDHHRDSYGVEVGYEGMAYDKLISLENLEDNADTVKVEDFRTGESFLGLIEEVHFINPTPTDKVNTGFGGTLLVTIRKL